MVFAYEINAASERIGKDITMDEIGSSAACAARAYARADVTSVVKRLGNNQATITAQGRTWFFQGVWTAS